MYSWFKGLNPILPLPTDSIPIAYTAVALAVCRLLPTTSPQPNVALCRRKRPRSFNKYHSNESRLQCGCNSMSPLVLHMQLNLLVIHSHLSLNPVLIWLTYVRGGCGPLGDRCSTNNDPCCTKPARVSWPRRCGLCRTVKRLIFAWANPLIVVLYHRSWPWSTLGAHRRCVATDAGGNNDVWQWDCRLDLGQQEGSRTLPAVYSQALSLLQTRLVLPIYHNLSMKRLPSQPIVRLGEPCLVKRMIGEMIQLFRGLSSWRGVYNLESPGTHSLRGKGMYV